MKKIMVVVPVPLDAEGMANREAQAENVEVGPDVELTYRAVKVGPDMFDSYHDFMLADVGIFEAAVDAQAEGFDAVCIDTMSDSGVNALRSMLDIPVVGPARASYLMALMLGNNFSVLTQWGPWKASYKKSLREFGLADWCVSIRATDIPPNLRDMLGGKEEDVFPVLLDEARRCVDDGAEVICLGSTTMHAAAPFLAENLPVPVIDPGPLTYKMAESMLALNLSHSRVTYQRPHAPKVAEVHAMLDSAAGLEH